MTACIISALRSVTKTVASKNNDMLAVLSYGPCVQTVWSELSEKI